MKDLRIVSLGCVLLLVAGSSQLQAADVIPLHEAIKDGKVSVTVTGLGGSTGDAIEIKARRKVSEPLRLTLTAGTVFKSVSGRVQDMAGASIKGERQEGPTYRPSAEIVLSDEQEHSYVVEAYCMDFHKDNPGTGDVFSVSPPDVSVAGLVLAGRKTFASSKVIQTALWMERDNTTPGQLKSRFSVDDGDIEAARRLVRTAQVEKESIRASTITVDPVANQPRQTNALPLLPSPAPGRAHLVGRASDSKSAKIRLLRRTGEKRVTITADTVVNHDGTFAFQNVEPGEYQWTSHDPSTLVAFGIVMTTEWRKVSAGETLDFDAPAPGKGHVIGKLTLPRFVLLKRSHEVVHSTTVGELGDFEFRDVEPGDYSIYYRLTNGIEKTLESRTLRAGEVLRFSEATSNRTNRVLP